MHQTNGLFINGVYFSDCTNCHVRGLFVNGHRLASIGHVHEWDVVAPRFLRQNGKLSLASSTGKATTMRLLVSHHSVLSTSTRAGGYYHNSLLWFLWLVGNSKSPSLRSSDVRKNSCMVIVSKWHSKNSHSSNTFPTPSKTTVALRYTVLYYRDPLAVDDGSRTKQHNPRTQTRWK